MAEERLPVFYQKHLCRLMGNMFPMHETNPKCQDLEREYFTCISNYGYDLGKTKCYPERSNLKECKYSTKSKVRRMIMTTERYNQGKDPLPEGPSHHHTFPFF